MSEEKGSLTLLALILSAIAALVGTLVWELAQDAASYYKLEQAYLSRQYLNQDRLIETFATWANSTPRRTSPTQFDLCTTNDSCLRLVPRTSPQPKLSQMLENLPRELCTERGARKTLYASSSCETPAVITPAGGYVFSNLYQQSAITIQTEPERTTRLLVLGSMKIPDLLIDATSKSSQVEIIVAGDAQLGSIRFLNTAVPTLLHLVRGKFNIDDATINLACSATQLVRIESQHPISIAHRTIQSSTAGCDFERDDTVWQTEFLLGQKTAGTS